MALFKYCCIMLFVYTLASVASDSAAEVETVVDTLLAPDAVIPEGEDDTAKWAAVADTPATLITDKMKKAQKGHTEKLNEGELSESIALVQEMPNMDPIVPEDGEPPNGKLLQNLQLEGELHEQQLDLLERQAAAEPKSEVVSDHSAANNLQDKGVKLPTQDTKSTPPLVEGMQIGESNIPPGLHRAMAPLPYSPESPHLGGGPATAAGNMHVTIDKTPSAWHVASPVPNPSPTRDYQLVATQSECSGNENYKGFKLSPQSCANACTASSKYFVYGQGSSCNTEYMGISTCKCFCEVPGSTTCNQISHSHYNLYEKTGTWAKDSDGSVSAPYNTADGLTLQQCKTKCEDGTWAGCAGFSRYTATADSAAGTCWWVNSPTLLLDDDGNNNEAMYRRVF